MALENLVIHSITGSTYDTSLYEYHQVMFGGAATADLNGTPVTVSGPITINLRVRTASHTSGADVFALGYRAAVEPLEQHFLNGGFRP